MVCPHDAALGYTTNERLKHTLTWMNPKNILPCARSQREKHTHGRICCYEVPDEAKLIDTDFYPQEWLPGEGAQGISKVMEIGDIWMRV